MDDTNSDRPDLATLFSIASSQSGYFTTKQAREAGYSPQLLAYHARTGRFARTERGIYRFRDYPSAPREELIAAWLGVGADAILSHESALELYDLSDTIPGKIHFTVPRSHRRLARRAGVMVHTTTRPLRPEEVTWRDGVRVTTVDRTIMDAAETGLGPEQITTAVHQALQRGLTTADRLSRAAKGRSQRVMRVVSASMADAAG